VTYLEGGHPPQICVYGAGAVGGHIAGRLAHVGAEVSLIARGAQLQAIQRQGLRVETREGVLLSRPLATDRPSDLVPQDLVLVAVKAPALPSIAASIASLLHRNSVVIFVGNGIPWWYFHDHGGDLAGTHLPRLDPGEALWREIGPGRAAGGVAFTAGTVVAPGVIRAENLKNRLVVGRANNLPDERLDWLAALLTSSGLEVSVTTHIRDAIWEKLSMNLIGGSLAVLCASPMRDTLDKPAISAAAEAMAREADAIARALGCHPGDVTVGLARLAQSGHLQSIAQDLQAGRPMEIDALFRVPRDVANMVRVPTPTLDLVTEMAIQRARAAGIYQDSAF
jgi:2-dehydropantoate 2-reductase